MSHNPITSIDTSAFRDMADLTSLKLHDIKLNNYRGDLNFLKKMNSLTELNMTGCFAQADFTHMENFPEVYQLERFYFGKVGLLSLAYLQERMPLLEQLDLADNKMYDLDAIDELGKLEHL